jgi:hypothetical protein
VAVKLCFPPANRNFTERELDLTPHTRLVRRAPAVRLLSGCPSLLDAAWVDTLRGEWRSRDSTVRERRKRLPAESPQLNARRQSGMQTASVHFADVSGTRLFSSRARTCAECASTGRVEWHRRGGEGPVRRCCRSSPATTATRHTPWPSLWLSVPEPKDRQRGPGGLAVFAAIPTLVVDLSSLNLLHPTV